MDRGKSESQGADEEPEDRFVMSGIHGDQVSGEGRCDQRAHTDEQAGEG